MARWTGEWLSTLSSGEATTGEPSRWPGERLGLPEHGPNAVAGQGRRLLALVVDLVVASLLTAIFTRPDYSDVASMQGHNLWSLAGWAVITVVPVALLRCALTFFIIPAAVRNADGRGWHDRLTNTVVVTMR